MLSLAASLSARLVARSAPAYTAALTMSARRNFSMTTRALGVIKVPEMAESITEGTLKEWHKKVGDYINADEEVATIETDKIDVAVNSPEAGVLAEVFAQEEDTVEVGKDLFKIEPGEPPKDDGKKSDSPKEESKEDDSKKEEPKKDDSKKEEPKKDESKKEEPKKDDSKKEEPREAPKKEEPKKDDSKKEEPREAPKKEEPKKSEPKKSEPKKEAKNDQPKPAAGSRNENRVKMNRMRKRIAERLKESQNTAASLTTFNEIDMTHLMEFRKRHKDRILKERGTKIGFMGAFTKACAMAMKDIPAANASIEGEGLGDTIVYRDYVDVGVAVSTEKGLVTPVVRNAESLSILEIEDEIHALGLKARDNKLSLEEMTGSTFTISNGGVFGSLFGTPILNLPGSAILGMHAVKQQPYVVDGKIEIRPIMVVALTYDHRLLDGREAVTFLVKLKQYIEDMPSMLL